MMKKFVVLIMSLAIILTSSMAFAAERDATNVMADVLFLRPIGVMALVVGAAAFAISLPAAAITHSTDNTYEVLVKDPYEYTFVRPVGEIGSGLD
jgi:hypothetical protein